MRADMQLVARRLVEEKVGSFTQSIEADIVSALEEMIEALQKAQQDAEERRNQQQQPQHFRVGKSHMFNPSEQGTSYYIFSEMEIKQYPRT